MARRANTTTGRKPRAKKAVAKSGSAGSKAVKSANFDQWAEIDNRFRSLDKLKITDTDQLVEQLNKAAAATAVRFGDDESMKSVRDLVYIGAVLETAIREGFISDGRKGEGNSQSISDFLTEANEAGTISVTPSYVRLGRRFFKSYRNGNMEKALEWHEEHAEHLHDAGWKPAQATGVVFVRDVLTGYLRFVKEDGERNPQAAIAEMMSGKPDREDKPTATERAELLQALAVALLVEPETYGSMFSSPAELNTWISTKSLAVTVKKRILARFSSTVPSSDSFEEIREGDAPAKKSSGKKPRAKKAVVHHGKQNGNGKNGEKAAA